MFLSSIFVGAMVLQYPIGWLSDRLDRRILIMAVAAIGAGACGFGWIFGPNFYVVVIAGTLIGGMSNPLYSLLIAYTNDYLDADNMAAASGGLIFVNGLGAIAGPVLLGWFMTQFGAHAFWIFIMILMSAVAGYAAYRMTRRASAYAEEDDYDAVPYALVLPGATVVTVEAAQEYYADAAEEMASDEADTENFPVSS